eukprot:gnl/MRDRNA2_/MRDRNA2_19792_c0_seq1.p1 gnl/MRDRNA2_/MRDRNA2_19792_c0~~gnl/MRDRNA2_/MRDRNA2_19792_c0_seq1.p1  ORF type:complete len:442 (-),score=61.10 gnl/MRDRNA2_/MRDRNA2_19792_c0_seq1:176-1321(-)
MACDLNKKCRAIQCQQNDTVHCTVRTSTDLTKDEAQDCWVRQHKDERSRLKNFWQPKYDFLLKEYPFIPVFDQTAYKKVNIILVRAPFRTREQYMMYEEYKHKILFLGVSSFEDFPLNSGNPFSQPFPEDFYPPIFPGFLHMMRKPEDVFPPTVKTLLLSQSDFYFPLSPPRDYDLPRKYDFTFSGTDQDVYNDCVGWSSYAKNWSFVKEALEVMCGEYNLKGVLVATISKDGKRSCEIPESCKGKMIKTKFLDQREYFHYLKQSRFAFLPQIHDASPRVTTQALAHDVPLLMNAHISGGWKYLNEKTGEFFHDMGDLRQSLEKILKGADIVNHYQPRMWLYENYGAHSEIPGKRFLDFVQENFAHRVQLRRGTTALMPER